MTLEEAFWKVHDGLPRQAPGSDQSTLHLLDLAGKPNGTCLDIGCGQGHASIILANAGIDVTAVDTHQPFLDELERSAHIAGVADRLTIRNIAMERLDYTDSEFDLIWSEGSAYIIGWEEALRSWRQFLKPGGILVATECSWLTQTPAEELRQFWGGLYPGMRSESESAEIAIRNGYDIIATYTLPRSDWDDYYLPLKDRVATLEESVESDESMRKALTMIKREIRMYEEYGDEYGYVGFVMRRRD